MCHQHEVEKIAEQDSTKAGGDAAQVLAQIQSRGNLDIVKCVLANCDGEMIKGSIECPRCKYPAPGITVAAYGKYVKERIQQAASTTQYKVRVSTTARGGMPDAAKKAQDASKAFKKATDAGFKGCADRWDIPNEAAFRMSYLKNGKDRSYVEMLDTLAQKEQHEWTINKDTRKKWYMGRPHIRQTTSLPETAPSGVASNPEAWKTAAKEAIKIKASLLEKRKREAESANAKGDLEPTAKASRTSYEITPWKSHWWSSKSWTSWSDNWSKSDKDWSDPNIGRDKQWEPQTCIGAGGDTELSSSTTGNISQNKDTEVSQESTSSKAASLQFEVLINAASLRPDPPIKAPPPVLDVPIKAPPPTIKAAPTKPPPPCARERDAGGDPGQQTIDRTTTSKDAGFILETTLSSPIATDTEVIPPMPTRPAPVWRPTLHRSEPVQLPVAEPIGFLHVPPPGGDPAHSTPRVLQSAAQARVQEATHRHQ